MLRYRHNYGQSSSRRCTNFLCLTVLLLTLFAGRSILGSPVAAAVDGNATTIAATVNASSNSSGDCACEPPCATRDSECAFGRSTDRMDCACCEEAVCARQIGESCNNHALVCDSELGLTCDNDTNTCSGPFNLRAFDVTHNSTLLRWRSLRHGSSGDEPLTLNYSLAYTDQFNGSSTAEWKSINLSALNGEKISIDVLTPNQLFYFRLTNVNSSEYEIVIVKTKDGCTFENASVGVGEKYMVGCERKCVCEENGSSSCSSRCSLSQPPSSFSSSSSANSNCKEVVDPHDNCCKIFSCEQRDGHSLTSGEPQVIVTGRTPDSLTIAWDDFKVPGFDQGYVVEYRPVTDESGQNVDWKTVNVEHGPFTTIKNLIPNTSYEIRVFIWEDVETKRYGPSTEIIVLTTEDGCIWDSKPLKVGQTYNKGCIGRCVCLGDDNSECGPRCSPPYFMKGISANNSDCTEEPLYDDTCCVSLLCISKSFDQTTFITSTSTTTTAKTSLAEVDLTSTTLATVSSTTEHNIGECPVSVIDTTANCPSNCKTDGDCLVGKRCCLSSCGSQVCVATNQRIVIVEETDVDPCSGIKCGANAVCHHIIGKARCFCIPGTTGNPDDASSGCISAILETPMVSNPCASIRCGPNAVCHHLNGVGRCYCLTGTSGNPDDAVNGCLTITSMIKPKTKEGCTFGNATYLIGETFYRGCDDKCQCEKLNGKFEVSCQPRCPRKEEKFGHYDEAACHYQVDPKDECCKLLVCQKPFENDAEQEVNNSHVHGGCEYKGKSYKRDEHFYEGCDLSCHCLDAGEVSCNPRCPPAPVIKPGCVAMPHPSDTECCTIAICNPFNLNFTLTPTLDDEETPIVLNDTSVNNATEMNNQTSLFNVSSLFEDSIDTLDNIENVNSTTDSTVENKTITSTDPDGMETSITLIHSNHSIENFTHIFQYLNTTDSVSEEPDFNSTLSRNSLNIFNVSEDDLASLFEDEEDSVLQENSTHAISNDGNMTSNISNQATDDFNITTSLSDTTNDTTETIDSTTIDLETTSEDGQNSTGKQKEVRLLQEVDGVFEFPKHVGRLADIHRILLIDSTTARVQIIFAPSIMEKIFMKSDQLFVLYTNNLTHTDLVDWERHPLVLQRNLGFVSVLRSDIAAETIITDLEPNRQYNFVIVLQKDNVDPDFGFQYQQLSDIEATVTVRIDGMCEFMGKTFNVGDRLYDECQAVCDCVEGPTGQTVNCEAILCPSQINPEKSGCLEWQVDLSFIPRAPHCCPEAVCKYGSMCTYKGKKFRNLAKVPQSLVQDCEQECTCVAGNVTCVPKCSPISDTPPKEECEGTYEIRTTPGETCCKYWYCVKDEQATTNSSIAGHDSSTLAVPHVIETTLATENASSTNLTESVHDFDNKTTTTTEAEIPQPECVFDNGTYRLNENWRVGKGHRQKLCTCLLMRNGTAGVECQGGCPSSAKPPMDIFPDCPPENLVTYDVPELCPYVVCNKSEIGRGVKNVTVDTLNATAIRVTFIIPQIYIGLYGQIDILYTMDLTHSDDTTTWNKEVFSGPSNQFENVRLSHEITGLQPDTEYYLKVLVVIKNTKNMDSSDMITIRMPPLPTTTTTTTTTTLPPKIYLDPKLSVSDITTTSVKISWRSFDMSEKRFVDGVQLHYKLHNDDTQQWSQTFLIHRDVVFFTMEHLKPNTEYDLNIVIVTSPNVSTEIMVGDPIAFKTLAIFDDYEFNLTLTVDKTTPYSIDLIWTGVPYPEHKYVNVYKILYQKMSKQENEPSFLYQSPKGNQFQSKIENLIPESNYTIWIEAFLTNGKVRNSNVINVFTKPGLLIANQSEKGKLEASTENTLKNAGNTYYAPFIVAVVIGTLCVLGFVILLIVLLRKQSSAKAPITTTKSHSAYDNPTYKTYDSELENGKSHTQ